MSSSFLSTSGESFRRPVNTFVAPVDAVQKSSMMDLAETLADINPVLQSFIATKALLAKGQVGNTTNLLVMDQARQGANYNEKVRQSIDSMNRQYLFDVKGTEAEYQGIRNRYRSNTIQAYNQIPSLGSILLNAAASGLQTYASLPTT